MTSPTQTRAFVAAAKQGQLRLREIAQAAGIPETDAWEILARGIRAGRLRVRDEDRTHQWIEVIE